MTTRVKVSGLTGPGDVELAIALGAWALGFAVGGHARRPGAPGGARHPGPTGPTWASSQAVHLSAGRVAELVAAARGRDPGVLAVACVPNADPAAIVRAAAAAGATAVEVGAESDAVALRAAMRGGGLAAAALIATRDTPGADEADFVVFPAHRPHAPAAPAASWDPFTRPAFKRVIVAGDIDAGNAREVVHRVHPFAIDVGEAVWAGPGMLDAGKLRELMAAVVAADVEEPWRDGS